jgi:DHA3 family macrolide efflux protein-like MFS transporter
MPTGETLRGALTFREVLRIDVMRRVWYAQIVSLFGDFLAIYAVISVISFRMHGTASQVTWAQIAYMLPLAVLGPVSGVFVDRWPLKATLVVSDLARAVLAVLLITSATVWQVSLVLAGISCVSSFFGPAQTVTIRSYVPREGLIAANGLMQMVMMGTRVVGPAAAGALVAAFGASLCYSLDVLSFLASASLIGTVVIRRTMAVPTQSGAARNRVHALWLDMEQGLRFIAGHPAVSFVVAAMAAGLFTVGCFGPLIAIYVRESLRASAAIFGLVSAAIGLGMIAGTPVTRALASRVDNSGMVLAGLGGIGAGALLLGAIPRLAAAVGATFTIGAAFAAIIVPAQTLLQQETPHEMMGRVSSTVMSVVFFAQILGLALSGVLAQAIGVRPVFVLCAALAAALAVGGRLFLQARSARRPAGVEAGV